MNTATIDLRLLAATTAFASTEPNRHYICGVFLEISHAGIRYVATDGHRLMASFRYASEGQPNFSANIIVATADCKRVKIGRRSDGVANLLANADGTYSIEHPDLHYKFTPVDGTYPDWRRVLPKAKAAWKPTFFNYDYAADFKKFAEKMGIGSAQVIERGEDPMPVLFDSDDSFGVLMPMRFDANRQWVTPDWVSQRFGAKVEEKATEPVTEPVVP